MQSAELFIRPKSYIFEQRLPLTLASAGMNMAKRTLHALALLSVLSFVWLLPRPALALVGAGVEGGIVKRSASEPGNLKLGFIWSLHAELALIPLIAVGPYYAHYELTGADKPNPLAGDAVFNVL